MIGCMNVHLSHERNRNIFLGAMSTLEVDVCVVTETWFREGLGDKVMENALEGSSFQWFGGTGRTRSLGLVMEGWFYSS